MEERLPRRNSFPPCERVEREVLHVIEEKSGMPARRCGDKKRKRWWQTKREERERGRDEAAKREVEDDWNSYCGRESTREKRKRGGEILTRDKREIPSHEGEEGRGEVRERKKEKELEVE